METHKPKPLGTLHKGLDQITQTRPPHPSRCQLAYKLAKSFNHKINQFAPLPYVFNVTNSTDLINQLSRTPVTPTTTFDSLDIANMYSNVHISETRQILENVTLNNIVDTDIRHEFLSWFDTITKQNYILHNNNIVIQKEGLAMGAPSSSILFEFFLQHIEHSHLPSLTQKHRLINYFRYVDDILLVYDSSHTDILSILNDFNSIHPNLMFTELEQDKKTQFPGHNNPQTPPGHKDVYIHKPYLYRHTDPIHIKPPPTT
jgi:hypothetical protein